MQSRIFIDGEQIPDERIIDIFRWPPDLAREFERSTLLIGSRGVGKTTLFRYLKVSHIGPSVHLALAAELQTFAKDAGLGPLASNYSKELERLIAKKATTVLALSLAERFLAKGLTVGRDAILPCIPEALLPVPPSPTVEWYRSARRSANLKPAEEFADVSDAAPLASFVGDVGEGSPGAEGPILLLLDRADMVVPAALLPVAELMDQSRHYVALVAMRPGHASEVFSADRLGAVPGDHFSVVNMGRAPYTTEWEAFLREATQAQFGDRLPLDGDLARYAYALARDSLRVALELMLACRGATGASVGDTLKRAVEMVRENHLVAAQHVLQPHHPDYRRLVGEIRKDTIKRQGPIRGPVTLEISDSRSPGLWGGRTRVDGFVDAALRCRAACMPSGQIWAPGARTRRIEIPPVVLWDSDDALWTLEDFELRLVRQTEGALFESGGRPKTRAAVFVAYRMDFDQSRKFRDSLEAILRDYPGPLRLNIVDGRVREGEDWAPAIRSRIKNAELVVGDVTGVRNDVVFELGFAYGLRKASIPVVESLGDRKQVPYWLQSQQIGTYSTENGLLSVASSVVAHIADPAISKPKRLRDPVPGLAIWLGARDHLGTVADNYQAQCLREGLTWERLDPSESEDIAVQQAARANLLAVVLTGGKTDALVHYVCGAIIARPKAGYGSSTLERCVLLLADPKSSVQELAADSLLRCTDVVVAPAEGQLQTNVTRLGRAYRHWIEAGAKRTRES